MLESGATRDELTIQLNSVSAETKNVVLDAKELAQSVQKELQAAGETLKSDADELVDESLTDAQIKSGLEAAVDEYEAGIASVKAQAGCSTQWSADHLIRLACRLKRRIRRVPRPGRCGVARCYYRVKDRESMESRPRTISR